MVPMLALVALEQAVRELLPWPNRHPIVGDRLEVGTDGELATFDAAGPDTVTFTFEPVDGDDLEADAQADGPSRPLPVLEIHRPTADRGADDVREHLDEKRCIFCKVPVGEDERYVQTDMFGMLVTRSICKGHSEHPESWHRATTHDAEAMGFCPSCGDVTRQDAYSEVCSSCNPVEPRIFQHLS